MVESKKKEEKNIEEEKTHPQKNKLLISITISVLILCLGATTLSLLNWIEVKESLRSAEAERLDLSRENTDYRELMSQQVKRNSDLLSDLTSRLSSLNADLAEIKNQRLALDSLYKKLSSAKIAWTLGEIEQALVISEQYLAFSGDVLTALKNLEKIKIIIDKSDFQVVNEIGALIDTDIKRLQSIGNTHILALNERLINLGKSVDAWPLNSDKSSNDERRSVIPEDSESYWQGGELLDNFIAKLRAMIRVDRIESKGISFLDQGQEFMVRKGIKMKILSARLAATIGDREMFITELAGVKEQLLQFFNLKSIDIEKALETIDEMISKPELVEIPSIQPTIDAVRALL